VVKDAAGRMLPDVTVVIKNDTFGVSQELTSVDRAKPAIGRHSETVHFR
jgi:hypothetical protein